MFLGPFWKDFRDTLGIPESDFEIYFTHVFLQLFSSFQMVSLDNTVKMAEDLHAHISKTNPHAEENSRKVLEAVKICRGKQRCFRLSRKRRTPYPVRLRRRNHQVWLQRRNRTIYGVLRFLESLNSVDRLPPPVLQLF